MLFGNSKGKFPSYDALIKYKTDDACMYEGKIYVALVDAPTSPLNNETQWKEFNGTEGVQGATGVQGPQGVQGANGQDGVIGSDGADGVQGPQGVQGTAGTTGADGQDGSDGVQGATGPQGATGSNGVQGVDGTQGSQGTQGTQGVQGTPGSLDAIPQTEKGAASGVATLDADGNLSISQLPIKVVVTLVGEVGTKIGQDIVLSDGSEDSGKYWWDGTYWVAY